MTYFLLNIIQLIVIFSFVMEMNSYALCLRCNITSHGNTKDTPPLRIPPLRNHIFFGAQNFIKENQYKSNQPFDDREIGQKGGILSEILELHA